MLSLVRGSLSPVHATKSMLCFCDVPSTLSADSISSRWLVRHRRPFPMDGLMEPFPSASRKSMLLQYSHDPPSTNISPSSSMPDKTTIQLFGTLKLVGTDETYHHAWKAGIFISEIKNQPSNTVKVGYTELLELLECKIKKKLYIHLQRIRN